jgi:hypothetical protein
MIRFLIFATITLIAFMSGAMIASSQRWMEFRRYSILMHEQERY